MRREGDSKVNWVTLLRFVSFLYWHYEVELIINISICKEFGSAPESLLV